jgi:hypothetical protein
MEKLRTGIRGCDEMDGTRAGSVTLNEERRGEERREETNN